jgi:two-component sensor histidine kinase
VHELASNSAKYGALSAPGGQVFVEGKIERIKSEDVFFSKWSELGGPQVMNPMRKGFGTSILEGVARQYANSVKLNYAPEGVVYGLQIDVRSISATEAHAS